jgi:streptogramin lyase
MNNMIFCASLLILVFAGACQPVNVLPIPTSMPLVIPSLTSETPLEVSDTPSLTFVSEGSWEYYQTGKPARDIAFDKNGNIWAVGDNASISIWDTNEKTFSHLQFPPSSDPRSLLGYDTVGINDEGEVWMSRTNYYISRYKDNNLQVLEYNSPFSFSSDGTVWATGSTQTDIVALPRKTFLAQLNQERWKEYDIEIEDKVSSMAVAPDGNIWVSLREWADEGEEFSKGVWKFDGERLIPVPELQDKFVFYELVHAPNGNIWCIGHPHALNFDSHLAHIKVFDGNKLILDFENPNRISDPTFDPDGNLWAISSYDFRILRFDEGSWTEMYTLSSISNLFDDSMKPTVIYSLDFFEDIICLGTDKGVYCTQMFPK